MHVLVFIILYLYISLIDSCQSPPFQKYVMFWVCPYDCNALCVVAFSWVTIDTHSPSFSNVINTPNLSLTQYKWLLTVKWKGFIAYIYINPCNHKVLLWRMRCQSTTCIGHSIILFPRILFWKVWGVLETYRTISSKSRFSVFNRQHFFNAFHASVDTCILVFHLLQSVSKCLHFLGSHLSSWDFGGGRRWKSWSRRR